jgi:hypothetical protein
MRLDGVIDDEHVRSRIRNLTEHDLVIWLNAICR